MTIDEMTGKVLMVWTTGGSFCGGTVLPEEGPFHKTLTLQGQNSKMFVDVSKIAIIRVMPPASLDEPKEEVRWEGHLLPPLGPWWRRKFR
jgi:hypothetical protein